MRVIRLPRPLGGPALRWPGRPACGAAPSAGVLWRRVSEPLLFLSSTENDVGQTRGNKKLSTRSS